MYFLSSLSFLTDKVIIFQGFSPTFFLVSIMLDVPFALNDLCDTRLMCTLTAFVHSLTNVFLGNFNVFWTEILVWNRIGVRRPKTSPSILVKLYPNMFVYSIKCLPIFPFHNYLNWLVNELLLE